MHAYASANGLDFTGGTSPVLEHASVPDGITRPDGSVWVYFVNGEPGQHAVFIAERQVDGSLETFDCIRLDGVINGDAVDPDILLQADGTYRLFYYQGHFVTPPDPNDKAHPFYSATSTDGIHFTVEEKWLETSDVGWDPSAVENPDGSWLIAINAGSEVLLASGPTLSDMTLTGQSFGQGIPELHRFSDGTLRLYGPSNQILRSDDGGDNFVFEGNMPGGADPSLIEEADGSYTLFTKHFDPSE